MKRHLSKLAVLVAAGFLLPGGAYAREGDSGPGPGPTLMQSYQAQVAELRHQVDRILAGEDADFQALLQRSTRVAAPVVERLVVLRPEGLERGNRHQGQAAGGQDAPDLPEDGRLVVHVLEHVE